MTKSFLKINLEQEKKKIVTFLKKTFREQGMDRAVIGLSGGVDSTLSFYLLKEVLPLKNITVAHLYYDSPEFTYIKNIFEELNFTKKNIHFLSIRKPVNEMAKFLGLRQADKVRLGNVMARVRMITLFDLAKKSNALVVGTENKSENLLGYFTRFGDAASDVEPISHLYKSQIFQLAKHLGIPQQILNQTPSAGLWSGQTDEGEFGFSYEEADQVLFLYVEKKRTLKQIETLGLKNAKQILRWREKNLFKHHVPYAL